MSACVIDDELNKSEIGAYDALLRDYKNRSIGVRGYKSDVLRTGKAACRGSGVTNIAINACVE